MTKNGKPGIYQILLLLVYKKVFLENQSTGLEDEILHLFLKNKIYDWNPTSVWHLLDRNPEVLHSVHVR